MAENQRDAILEWVSERIVVNSFLGVAIATSIGRRLMEILKVEGLTKSFGGLVAVNNLDFNVEDGEIIGLIGPNGSGKTTVLNLITGFHKHTAGRITYRGRVVTGEGHTDEKWWFDVHYVDGELRISE